MPFTPEQQKAFDDAYSKAMASNADEKKLVGIVDFMIKYLVQCGEAVEREMHCMTVVPHKMNRGGALMQHVKVFTKLGKILHVGFSFQKCDASRAVCFQKKSGSVSKFLSMANTNPYFATFEEHKVEAESV